MKKLIFFILVADIRFTAAAQNDHFRPASKESQACHLARKRITTPPYGLDKVKKIIGRIKGDDEEGIPEIPPAKVYESMTLREKFTYHMIYAESSAQNCDGYPILQDEQKKIFGHLPDVFDERHWSERQEHFFTDNSDSVVKLIKESVLRSKKMGLNYKQVIIEMNAIDMIPFLVSTYNTDRKDHDILTVLLLLMEQNKYEPFMASVSHQKLYGDAGGEYSYYEAYLVLNKANEDLIIQRATDFYKEWRKM